MTARTPDLPRTALAVLLFLVAWGVIHVGFYEREQIVDTPVYESYGEAMEAGQVPYRDFAVEYPPGALPVFVVPALADSDFRVVFEWLMALCGCGVVVAVAIAGRRLGFGFGTLAFVALSPLAIGSVILTRFDLWPAMLASFALAALVHDRYRLGHGLLGAAIAAKLYPGRPASAHRRVRLAAARPARGDRLCGARGRGSARSPTCRSRSSLPREWCAASAASCRGRCRSRASARRSCSRRTTSSGPASRWARATARRTSSERAPTCSPSRSRSRRSGCSPGSGSGSRARGSCLRPRTLAVNAAAALTAFVALGKVLSPQFLIWLVPVVVLARRASANAMLAAALVLTQLWFPFRYWDLVRELDPRVSWLVLARDLVLLALLATLVRAVREPARGSSRSS